MLAQLGDIQFEGLNTPQSWSEAHAVQYGEVPHIGGKSSLQMTGEDLVKIDLNVRLSTDFCDPSETIEKLKTAQRMGEVLPFITGTGVLVGRYVITSVDVDVKRTGANGELKSATLSIALTEYVPPPGSEKEEPKGEAIKGRTKQVAQPPAIPVVTEAQSVTNDLSKAQQSVNVAKNILADVRKGTKSLKRGVREVKQTAQATKDFFSDAKSKVIQTKKIVQRASQLPTSLDEAIMYADNLAKIDNLASIATLEIRTNELVSASDKVAKRAAPVVAFVGTKEGGN